MQIYTVPFLQNKRYEEITIVTSIRCTVITAMQSYSEHFKRMENDAMIDLIEKAKKFNADAIIDVKIKPCGFNCGAFCSGTAIRYI